MAFETTPTTVRPGLRQAARARIARWPLGPRVAVAILLGAGLGQLSFALLLLAGLIGGDCDICADQPAAGLLLAGLVLTSAIAGFASLFALVRPGFRIDTRVVGVGVATVLLVRFAWPW